MHWLGNHAPSCSESWSSWEKGRNEPLLGFGGPPVLGLGKEMLSLLRCGSRMGSCSKLQLGGPSCSLCVGL